MRSFSRMLLGALLVLALPLSGWAQAAPEVLILPVEMPGYYNPVDSDALTRSLETSLRKLSPRAHLQLSRPADLTAYGYQAGGDQPPSLDMADRLCRAYGANQLAWVSIRFQPDYTPDTGVLALAGAARVWGYSATQRRVMFDEPLSLVRVDQVRKNADAATTRAATQQLSQGLVGDLAYQLAGVARQRQVRPPASAADWQPVAPDPTQSKAYKTMVSATQHYQKAVRDSSLVDITTSQAAMTRAWTALNQSERDAIERNYPDIKDAMTEVPVYNYGGYYWGWGYRY
jgi:hypothetical protein